MALLDPEGFTDLRIAFVGGEAFSGELVNRWNKGRRLFNGYGPTECTVTMIVEECQATGTPRRRSACRWPTMSRTCWTASCRLLPLGVPGELVIGGAGLAAATWAARTLTAEKFFADPFGTAWGGRLYRTGDLVKRLPRRRLVFLGRVDQQVKIRGLRIELGEVESALAAFPGIGPGQRPGLDRRRRRQAPGRLRDPGRRRRRQTIRGSMRGHLAGRCPLHDPVALRVLDELPLTSSGKVDRRRLPDPDLAAELAAGVDAAAHRDRSGAPARGADAAAAQRPGRRARRLLPGRGQQPAGRPADVGDQPPVPAWRSRSATSSPRPPWRTWPRPWTPSRASPARDELLDMLENMPTTR